MANYLLIEPSDGDIFLSGDRFMHSLSINDYYENKFYVLTVYKNKYSRADLYFNSLPNKLKGDKFMFFPSPLTDDLSSERFRPTEETSLLIGEFKRVFEEIRAENIKNISTIRTALKGLNLSSFDRVITTVGSGNPKHLSTRIAIEEWLHIPENEEHKHKFVFLEDSPYKYYSHELVFIKELNTKYFSNIKCVLEEKNKVNGRDILHKCVEYYPDIIDRIGRKAFNPWLSYSEETFYKYGKI